MRVIAGSARGHRLAGIDGDRVRPTPDRVREALFSILTSRFGSLTGLAVLDVFSGSGALAIEALSRGAAKACLIERSRQAQKTIEENLARCALTDKAILYRQDSWQVLPGLRDVNPPFDLIFVDPPYGQGLAVRAVEEVARHGLLAEEGILCVETGAEEELPEAFSPLERSDRRRYGSVKIDLYTWARQDGS